MLLIRNGSMMVLTGMLSRRAPRTHYHTTRIFAAAKRSCLRRRSSVGLRFFHAGAVQLNEVEVSPGLKSVPSVGVMRCHLLLHESGLLQLCVFDFGLLQDREIRVSVLPKREELLIAGPSF